MISINTHNHTTPHVISQENYSTSFGTPLSSKIFLELFALKGNGNHPGIARVMDELAYRVNFGKSMKVARQTLATKTKLTPLHVGKLTKILEETGAIFVKRVYRQENTYTINYNLFNKELRLAIKHLIPQFDDKHITLRKREADEICAMKEAKNYYARSFIGESLDLSDSNYDFEDDFQKKHHSLKGNYITHARACDDGWAAEFDNDPVWLVDDMPIGSDDCIFEKNSRENHKTAGLAVVLSSSSPLSPNIFIKKSSEVAELKKGTGMEDNLYEQVIPVAAQLRSIRPTKWGQIKLSAFSDEAILYADGRMLKTATAVSDKFKYFVKICKLHSDEQQLPISWATMIELGAKYKMGDVHVWLDESFVPVKVAAKSKRTANDSYGSGVQHKASTVTYKEAAAANKAMIEQYAPCLLENKPQTQTMQEELDDLKITNPVAYERRTKYAHDLLVACGRDPITGDALPGFDEKSAVQVLNSALNLTEDVPEVPKTQSIKQLLQSMAQLSKPTPILVTEPYIEFESDLGMQQEMYALDPFGDFN